MTPIPEILVGLMSGRPLSEAQAEGVFEELLAGRLHEAQIGALLALIQRRGATVDELVGAARVMRRHVTPVQSPLPKGAERIVVLDTCGTGGAGKLFNVSTAAALVAAAASPHHEGGDVRVVVAKHGNRGRSGRGSAEVLGALGVNVDAGPGVQASCLDRAGVCFCFAIHHHPAMKHAAGARRALGFPTIFNLLGPLTNPAGAPRQLIGVFDAAYVEKLAETLGRLGSLEAWVVHAMEGLDEISITGPTKIARLRDGRVAVEEFRPESMGLRHQSLDGLVAGDLEEAAAFVRDVLAGSPGPRRDIVVLNAAAALLVAGACEDLREGCRMAGVGIDSGRARAALRMLADCSRG